MAKSLRMDPNDMKELFEEGMQGMRMKYYPSCPQPELVIGLSPHSDVVGVAILLQLNEMEGLQIKKDGMWVPPGRPLPDAFIIDIGNSLECGASSNCKLRERKTVYRRILQPETRRRNGSGAKPLALFRRIGVADFFKGFYLRDLLGKSYVDVMGIRKDESKSC